MSGFKVATSSLMSEWRLNQKNYADPVGLERVESFKAKLEDIAADLGGMVCPAGFTQPARDRAAFDRIQLFEIVDAKLGNNELFVPLRYVEPNIVRFGFQISGRANSTFSIPSDPARWRFKVDGRIWTAKQMVRLAWNKRLVPQKAGVHVADFGAVIIMDRDALDEIQYCEFAIEIHVSEKYYLKLMPASVLRSVDDGREKFNLEVDLHSTEEDMTKNGWKRFEFS